jgi:hypothetical protein
MYTVLQPFYTIVDRSTLSPKGKSKNMKLALRRVQRMNQEAGYYRFGVTEIMSDGSSWARF